MADEYVRILNWAVGFALVGVLIGSLASNVGSFPQQSERARVAAVAALLAVAGQLGLRRRSIGSS